MCVDKFIDFSSLFLYCAFYCIRMCVNFLFDEILYNLHDMKRIPIGNCHVYLFTRNGRKKIFDHKQIHNISNRKRVCVCMCIVLPFLIHSNGFPFCQALEFWYYCMFFNTSFGFLSSVLVRYDFDCECVWRKWTKFQIEHIGWIKMMCCMRVCWLALIKIKKIHRHFASELNYFIFGLALAEIVILVHWRTILSGYNSCHHNSFHNVFRWATTTALPSPIWMNDWTNE